jgi:hypothetical protein
LLGYSKKYAAGVNMRSFIEYVDLSAWQAVGEIDRSGNMLPLVTHLMCVADIDTYLLFIKSG